MTSTVGWHLHDEMSKRMLARLDMMKIAPKKVVQIGARPDAISSVSKKYPHARHMHYAIDAPLTVLGIDCLIIHDVSRLPISAVNFFKHARLSLSPGGLLLFTSLGVDSWKELSAWVELNFIDMHDMGDILLKEGFEDPVMDRENIGLTYKKIDTLMADWEATYPGSHLPRDDALDAIHEVTIELLHGHAWQPLTVRASKDEETGEIAVPITSVARAK